MNPRLVKEADALTEAGYKVLVIAPDFSEWAAVADEEYLGRSWEIVERPRYGPLSPRLKRISELARRLIAGFATQKLGIRTPWFVNAAWHPATPLLVAAAKRHKADLYIAHLVAALPAAAIAARHHNALYAFDAEDFHLGEFAVLPSNDSKKQLVKLIEGRYLADCAYVTAASPLIADAYSDTYGISIPNVVLNVFPLAQAPKCCPPQGSISQTRSVYWFSNVIGPHRGLECAVEAICLALSKPHLFLRGAPLADYCRRLESIAHEGGAGERLHFLPLGLPTDLARLAVEYDVGFVGEPGGTLNSQKCLSNKQFYYLLAGLPIVMSNTPAHRKFALGLEPAVLLYTANDPKSLAIAFDRLLMNPKALTEARNKASNLGQKQFNWDIEKHKLLAVVQQALNPNERKP